MPTNHEYEHIVMWSMEDSGHYGPMCKRYDLLLSKGQMNTISDEEEVEFTKLDDLLAREYRRQLLHFKGNWQFMTKAVKQMWLKRGREWNEKSGKYECLNCGHIRKDHEFYKEPQTGSPVSRCMIHNCNCGEFVMKVEAEK